MHPIENTIQIGNFSFLWFQEGDITQQTTVDQILSVFQDKTGLVVCDGAPDVTGLHEIDQYIQT